MLQCINKYVLNCMFLIFELNFIGWYKLFSAILSVNVEQSLKFPHKFNSDNNDSVPRTHYKLNQESRHDDLYIVTFYGGSDEVQFPLTATQSLVMCQIVRLTVTLFIQYLVGRK